METTSQPKANANANLNSKTQIHIILSSSNEVRNLNTEELKNDKKNQ